MWWIITLHFGFRARDEARKLCFGDIKLCVDENNGRYIEWDTERGSKTRTGAEWNNNHRIFNPKAYETGLSDCPVKIYEKFLKFRPPDACQEDSPFFLRPKVIASNDDNSAKTCDNLWYYSTPLGKNKLGKFLSDAAPLIQDSSEKEKSRSKVSNHSARKTSITVISF